MRKIRFRLPILEKDMDDFDDNWRGTYFITSLIFIILFLIILAIDFISWYWSYSTLRMLIVLLIILLPNFIFYE
jgi:hypothetical protein